MNHSGKIIVLAYPDTFVNMSTEWICKALPYVGLGTKERIKAGHAALVLIENKTGKAKYFDFGRYVTPKGCGRVRGENTDAELNIPFNAKIDRTGEITNLSEFLLWLASNPEKTHGEGRLLASVCDEIEYDKGIAFIKQLQDRGSIAYGAFTKNGSNCARFVTDTILAATSNRRIKKSLSINKKFTPSTVGNVEKAATNNMVYEVYEGSINNYNGSALGENLRNYFDKNHKPFSPNEKFDGLLNKSKTKLQKLYGIGSSAWFEIKCDVLPTNHHRICRYNELGEVDFDGIYVSEEFDVDLPYKFTYDSHCEYCHIIQGGVKKRLQCVSTYESFNLSRKQHSA